jgi:hypothetical protein
VTAHVERRAPGPGVLEPVRGRRDRGLSRAPLPGPGFEVLQAREPVREQAPAQPQPVRGRRPRQADRHMGGPDGQDDEPLPRAVFRERAQDIVAAPDLPVVDAAQEVVDETLAEVRRPGVSVARRRGALLDAPVREPHAPAAGRIPRVGPSEPCVEEVLDRLPGRPAFRAGRVDVETPQRPVRPRDPARHEEIDFEPSDMGVGRGEDRRTARLGNPREGEV